MVWDRGFWVTDQNVDEALRAGQLNFRLYGEKLKGSWALTRCGSCSDQQQEWLLTKSRDLEARSLQEMNIVAEQSRSVLTRRTHVEIARRVPSLIPGRLPRKQTRDPNQRLLFPNDLRS